MKKLIARLTGRGGSKRMRFISHAPSGSVVFARHAIQGSLSFAKPVPAGARGILRTAIDRDASVTVIVDWDGIGPSDALASDLSPHFETAAAPSTASPAPTDSRARDELAAAIRAATSRSAPAGPAPSRPAAPQQSAPQAAPSRPVQQPSTTKQTKTVYVRDEPYDPSAPEEPQRPLRPGETRKTVIITDEPM